MYLQAVLAYQKSRIRNPWVWLPILGLGICMGLAWLPWVVHMPLRERLLCLVRDTISGLAMALLYVWFSPGPWLWTGGRATHAPFLRGFIQAALGNSAFAILLSFLQAFGFSVLEKYPFEATRFLRELSPLLMMSVPGAMLAGYFVVLWERTRVVKEETEKKLREAHWVLLRGQLSPHVLFNALNGVAELVHIDPVRAEQAILDLSDLYRTLLDHGSRPLTPLKEERRLVTRYLNIESMRLGPRLQVAWDWDESLQDVTTPPLLVQPLVENALKHGIAPHPEGGEVRVGLVRDGADLVLSVSNTGRALPLVMGSGVGVGNLEARLHLAFGGKATFRLRGGERRTTAEIRIPLELVRRPA